MDAQEIEKFKKLYVDTTSKQLEQAQQLITQLFDDSQNKEILQSLYVLFHTIASKSLIMGYEKTGVFCRKIEQILNDSVQNHTQISPEFVNQLSEDREKVVRSLSSIASLDKEEILLDNK